MSIKITNGIIIDGTGRTGYPADIGIQDGRIVAIGNLKEEPAADSLDADGLYIAPGFIDAHSHSDDWYFTNPWAVSKILQGVTTEITGHCGESPAPLSTVKRVSTTDGHCVAWRTIGELRTALTANGIGVNVAVLAGHNTIRSLVMDGESREATGGELTVMRDHVRKALAEGACGLSTGLIYPPGCYADRFELSALAACLKATGGVYTSHLRDEGARLRPALAEAVAICAAAGVRGVVSHLKAAGRRNWGGVPVALSMLTNARRRGVDIYCDVYPYTALGTNLATLLPSWAHAGGPDALKARLEDTDQRPALMAAIAAREADFADIVITQVAAPVHRPHIGRALPEIAATLGCAPAEAVINLLAGSGGEVSMIWQAMSENDVVAALRWPFSVIGSDAGARVSYGPLAAGLPHPRAYGTFPRFLGRYVRDMGLLSLPAAIAKITALPAKIFGLHYRGRITRGYRADLTVFDYHALIDNATYDDPFKPPAGIMHVLVNGVPAVRDHCLQYRLPGHFLTTTPTRIDKNGYC